MPLFLALIAVPLIEIALFAKVGALIGVWPTVALVILTAIVGSSILRAQGMAALREVQGRLRRGEDPGRVLAHGALILVAGVFLMVPGFFTDALGLLLLVPPVRTLVIGYLGRRMIVRTSGIVRTEGRGPATLDGEYEIVDGTEGDGEGPAPGRSGQPGHLPRGHSGWTDPPR